MTEIEAECPSCGGRGKVPDNQIGHNATCPRCRTEFIIEQKLELVPTLIVPDERSLDCPVCDGASLEVAEPGWRCTRCQGSYLDRAQTDELLRSMSIEPASLYEPRAVEHSRTLPCPGCAEAMMALILRGATIDHCGFCGGLWLDGGELHRVSGGRFGQPFDASRVSSSDGGEEQNHDRLEEILEEHQVLSIRQDREWTEIIVGWKTANRCSIFAGDRAMAHVLERGRGIGRAFGRQFLGSRRPLEVQVIASRSGSSLLFFERPFYWLFSSMTIFWGLTERMVGQIDRRFAVFLRIYDLHDDTGCLFARIRSPWWRFRVFSVVDLGGRQQATISKNGGGFLREGLTDPDGCVIDLGVHSWTLSQKAVLLAAAISLNPDIFECP